jgi:exocyst complex component 8
MADLRVLYASQLHTLHAQIEGSAKFIPTTPGRHVVAEMDSGVFALHSATYKVAHPVRFVLLDDAVLVARKRHRRNDQSAAAGSGAGAGSQGKWVAERAWSLTEMVVLETKDTPSPPYFLPSFCSTSD